MMKKPLATPKNDIGAIELRTNEYMFIASAHNRDVVTTHYDKVSRQMSLWVPFMSIKVAELNRGIAIMGDVSFARPDRALNEQPLTIDAVEGYE